MITDINFKSEINKFDSSDKKLNSYWNQYQDFEKDIVLLELCRDELLKEINLVKKKAKPYIDSKVLISDLLTKFGEKHNFHRQFNERHQNLHKEQVLGMLLYKLMVEDVDVWIYYPTLHKGHVYPNATYTLKL
ncbi:MAG: hypothetical protein P4L28_04710 [Paludibacteraceae bacterium]|nr:hypothetical protein [Paludibacteraceae bacterium]